MQEDWSGSKPFDTHSAFVPERFFYKVIKSMKYELRFAVVILKAQHNVNCARRYIHATKVLASNQSLVHVVTISYLNEQNQTCSVCTYTLNNLENGSSKMRRLYKN